jgi:hypothetical protein
MEPVQTGKGGSLYLHLVLWAAGVQWLPGQEGVG